MTGLRLLAVHAHPDDEASKGAATTARYAAEGHDVLVATLTGGERGDVLNPAMDTPEVNADIPGVRRGEMARAAEILGVRHEWVGFVDSGLPQGDPLPPLPEGCFALVPDEEAVVPLVRIVRRFRPHVIVTYDENGGYPHPDHLKTHAISMLAWDLAGDPAYLPGEGEPWLPQKLYYTHGFIRRRMELFHHDFVERGLDSPFAMLLDRWKALQGDLMARVTTQVRCERWFDARDEALRAHATQIDPNGPFFAAPVELQRRLWPTEEFELARTRVSTDLPEDDLFAGVVAEGLPIEMKG